MTVNQKAFHAEAKRLQDVFGMSRDQAEMLAAVKFWEAPQREWTQEEIDADMLRCEEPEDCGCEDAVEDILSGRVECFRCGRVWYT